jgi:hypothetical protein
MNRITRTLLLAAATLFAQSSWAAEGGSSVYLQGTYGDFQAAPFGPAGLYFRDDVVRYDASIGPRPLGGRVAAETSQKVWINIAHLACLTDYEILGARYGAAIALPYVINAHVEGEGVIGGNRLFRDGDVSGQGDIFLSPMLLNWKLGNHNLTFAPGINIPVGKYNVDNLLNTGRNYYALDIAGSWTWLHPTRGHELSMTAGVLFNERNSDTNYRTGNEFHLDALLGQYFSESFGVGLVGYYYEQISDDDGTIIGWIDGANFQSEGAGFGPAVLYSFKAGERSINLIGKALFDTRAENRFDGDLYMLSVAFKL